ncbi:MAG: hypothetical protein M0R17_03505 [Candidatus Omnitrophica bacterium]|jgi:hypothetical protein|nr:hypothetical protein [Candidatus Omnitrophota bacterium]
MNSLKFNISIGVGIITSLFIGKKLIDYISIKNIKSNNKSPKTFSQLSSYPKKHYPKPFTLEVDVTMDTSNLEPFTLEPRDKVWINENLRKIEKVFEGAPNV